MKKFMPMDVLISVVYNREKLESPKCPIIGNRLIMIYLLDQIICSVFEVCEEVGNNLEECLQSVNGKKQAFMNGI